MQWQMKHQVWSLGNFGRLVQGLVGAGAGASAGAWIEDVCVHITA